MATPDYSTWLTKQQAADAIGVSTKTVEQFAKDRHIDQASWRPQGRGAARAVYNPDDVARLAADRQPAAAAFVLPAVTDPTNGNGRHTTPGTALAPARLGGAGPDAARAFLEAMLTGILAQNSQTSDTSQSSQKSETLYVTVQEAAAILGLPQADVRRPDRARRHPDSAAGPGGAVTDVWIKSSEQLAARWCPSCQRLLDAVTSATVGDEPATTPVPEPGDVTICGYCSAILVFTVENFRLATQAEVDALPDLTKRLALMCERVPMPDGGFAIVCVGRHGRRLPCVYCGEASTCLCDGPGGASRRGLKSVTCDRPLCGRCRIHVPPNQDFCRDHRQVAKEAAALFDGAGSFAMICGIVVHVRDGAPSDDAVMVCGAVGEGTWTACADCGAPILVHPTTPPLPVKICLACARRRLA